MQDDRGWSGNFAALNRRPRSHAGGQLGSQIPHPSPQSMSTKPRTASDFAEEYCFVVDQIHGMYLDASMGMGELARGYMQYDADRLQQLREAGQQRTPEIFNPELSTRAR